MPTYEYECTKCGHAFERFQSMTDSPVKRCPICRCKVRRLIGAGAGILFKGSGFYQTDYRSSDYHKAAEGDRKKADTTKSTDAPKTSDSDKSTAATTSKPASAKAKAS